MMLTNFMDPVIAAQVRLEQAVNRLEEALAAGDRDGQSGQNGKLAAVSAELERVRAENAALLAVKKTATERLDAAIRHVKGLIES
jgi:hypothetical protein